jgi:rhodanese-related sulfurtransferase
VLDQTQPQDFNIKGSWQPLLPIRPEVASISAMSLAGLLNEARSKQETIVIDLGRHAQYVQGHIPGACYVLRSQYKQALAQLPKASRVVLTCPDGVMAGFAFESFSKAFNEVDSSVQVLALEGGTQSWRDAGLALEKGPTHLISPPLDRYKRPYEGTDNAREAMQGYLDWEFGLVEQLGRDGTHHFWVI